MTAITVRYFALLREQAGCSVEPVETAAATASALYAELAARHGFSLRVDQVRVAINAEYRDSGSALQPGDEVVFIPPVSGG